MQTGYDWKKLINVFQAKPISSDNYAPMDVVRNMTLLELMRYIHALRQLNTTIGAGLDHYAEVVACIHNFDFADIVEIAIDHPDLYYMATWINKDDDAAVFYLLYLPYYIGKVPHGAHPLALQMIHYCDALVKKRILPSGFFLPMKEQNLKTLAAAYLVDQFFSERYAAAGMHRQWIESTPSYVARMAGIYQPVTQMRS